MSAADLYIPNQGPSFVVNNADEGGQEGARRPPEPTANGLVVVLSRIEGFTKPGLLASPFYFQCAPIENFPQEFTWQWTDYLTLGSGYHSQPNAPGLRTWTFDTLFVDDDYTRSFTQIHHRDILAMLDRLIKIGDSMTPFQLQIGQPALWGRWDVVTGATLRSLHIEERGGETDARYITVSFTEFPDSPTHAPVPGHPPHHKPKHGSKYLAILDSSKLPESLNTLAKIAKRYYGKVSDWRAIAKASGFKGGVGPNTNLKETVGKRHPPAKVKVPRLKKPPTPQSGKGGGKGQVPE